jgi:Partial alpha/beta-hydrolase lipase region
MWRIHALKLPCNCPVRVAELEGDASRAHHRPARLRRSASFSAYETLHGVWTAKDVIQSAGYPMEPHIVTTSDGYIMQMERIPRRGAPPAQGLCISMSSQHATAQPQGAKNAVRGAFRPVLMSHIYEATSMGAQDCSAC